MKIDELFNRCEALKHEADAIYSAYERFLNEVEAEAKLCITKPFISEKGRM